MSGSVMMSYRFSPFSRQQDGRSPVALFFLISLVVVIFFFVPAAHLEARANFVAQTPATPAPGSEIQIPVIPKPNTLPGPTLETQRSGGTRDYVIKRFLPGFTSGFIALVGATAVIFMIVGGIQFLMAYGNEESITTAKKNITWSIVGFIIALLAYAIVKIISFIIPNTTPPAP